MRIAYVRQFDICNYIRSSKLHVIAYSKDICQKELKNSEKMTIFFIIALNNKDFWQMGL